MYKWSMGKYLEIKATYNEFETIYTGGSTLEEKASAAAYTSEETYQCRLPDVSTVVLAELKALCSAPCFGLTAQDRACAPARVPARAPARENRGLSEQVLLSSGKHLKLLC